MILDLEDIRIRARLCIVRTDRVRLTIEYPRTPEYRDIINAALANLLRPSQSNMAIGASQIEGRGEK